MDFARFSRRAAEIIAGIPEEFLRGIVGIEAHRSPKEDPELEGVFILGECEDDPATALTDPEALRSRIHLYHGSFRAVAAGDDGFDWEEELAETILHEIQHHIEDRAGIPDLILEDLRRFVELREERS
jgi:hypothetical protein